MVSLTELKEPDRKRLAEKIREGLNIMLKNQSSLKSINKICEDLEKIKQEIYKKKAYFKVFFNKNKAIEGFYYIRVNDNEKFLEPFFETEFFYSETPKSFFKCLKESANDLRKLKEEYPEIKQYIGYYTVDESGEALSHAKIANKRIKEVFEGKINFKEVFKTFIGKIYA